MTTDIQAEKGDLRVSLVQSELVWEDPVANRKAFERALEGLAGKTDLILLPEMFTTGFSMRADELAEDAGGTTTGWMLAQADRLDAAICGSVMVDEDGSYYNRCYFAEPGGRILHYDKRHLFGLAGEDKVYSAGTERLTLNWQGWRIRLAVCYDLRFPVWLRQDVDDRYDVLVLVANWPERRRFPWRQLLRTRAIENIAYVAAVNRCGMDGNDVDHSGDSALIDPLGETLLELASGAEIKTGILSKAVLHETRERFAFLDDADRYDLRL